MAMATGTGCTATGTLDGIMAGIVSTPGTMSGGAVDGVATSVRDGAQVAIITTTLALEVPQVVALMAASSVIATTPIALTVMEAVSDMV